MQKSFYVNTNDKEDVIDITREVVKIVKESGIDTGIVNIFIQGATASIAIQENSEGIVQNQSLLLLDDLLRNKQSGGAMQADTDNITAHMKANILGPSKTIPVTAGKLGISIWQSILLYEFDGPRKRRTVVVTICRSN
ncbi:MAG: secondary thiamine-phosphate synthase enzyme YjbQ [Bacteroidales bacterium]|jgi:secondary thiamine-phosphate synthase enzyme|nr:secondary thiamine-phosphate synthase enzyme YjbQ [Bacteroidales bacterium]